MTVMDFWRDVVFCDYMRGIDVPPSNVGVINIERVRPSLVWSELV